MKNLESELLAKPVPALNASKRARLYRAIGLSLAGLVLVGAGIHVAANVWLNRYVRPKVEKTASVHLPGTSLRLGALRYEFWRNRLQCASLDLSMPGGELAKMGSVSVTGVGCVGGVSLHPGNAKSRTPSPILAARMREDLNRNIIRPPVAFPIPGLPGGNAFRLWKVKRVTATARRCSGARVLGLGRGRSNT